jgi:hypothetical protein
MYNPGAFMSGHLKYIRRPLFKYLLVVVSDSCREFKFGEKVFAHFGALDILKCLYYRGYEDENDMPDNPDIKKVVLKLVCQKTHLFSTLHTLHSCLYSKFIYEGNEYPLKYKVPVNIKMRNRYDLYSRI